MSEWSLLDVSIIYSKTCQFLTVTTTHYDRVRKYIDDCDRSSTTSPSPPTSYGSLYIPPHLSIPLAPRNLLGCLKVLTIKKKCNFCLNHQPATV